MRRRTSPATIASSTPGSCSERAPQSLRLLGRVMRQLESARLPQERDALEDVLGGLLAEARQPGQPAVPRGGLELGEGVDAEGVVDLADLGDAESGDLQHLDQAGGHLFAQFLEQGGAPAGHQLLHDLQGRRADALGAGEGAVARAHPPVRPAGLPTARAAVRKARTRKGFSPLSSRNEAICSSTWATAFLSIVNPQPMSTGRCARWLAPTQARASAASGTVRAASSRSSSPPTIEWSPAAAPPVSAGAKSGEPSARSQLALAVSVRVHHG